MNPGDLLRTVAEALERLEIPYLVTGSTAAVAYGEPRFTDDIDIAIQLDAQALPAFEQTFPAPKYDLDTESMALAVARHSSFQLIHTASGLKAMFSVADDSSFNTSRFRRARTVPVGGGPGVQFASPEDVILEKLESFEAHGSQKHLRDITGVLRVSEIDLNYIDLWAERLGLSRVWGNVRRGSVLD